MNVVAYFEIQADWPLVTIEFYRAVFGWQFLEQNHLPVPYWRIETGGIRGGLLQRAAAVPAQGHGTNAFVCSVEVENFDRAAMTVTEFGGQVAMAKFAVPGIRWQGYFIDPAGNTFGIFQSDANAG